MKIRNGFVSNSSSSSFLMFIPKNTKTINNFDDIEDYLGFQKEDFELFIKEKGDEIDKMFKRGYGFIINSVEYGCEETLIKLVDALDGKIIDMGFY